MHHTDFNSNVEKQFLEIILNEKIIPSSQRNPLGKNEREGIAVSKWLSQLATGDD